VTDVSTLVYNRARAAAAFAARLRRERPGPDDAVFVALDVVDRAGVSVGPLRWPVEVAASAPALGLPGPGSARPEPFADAYVEALVDAVTRALGDLPGGWFDVGWHPLPVRVEGAALAIEKGG
jgi:hypothetical protein